MDSTGLHSRSAAVQSCRSSAQPHRGCGEGHPFIALKWSLLGFPAELAPVYNLELALAARIRERRCGQKEEV